MTRDRPRSFHDAVHRHTDRPGALGRYPHDADDIEELSCPSVDICAWCADSECDGIGCIASLDPDKTADHEAIEQLHSWLRRGQLAEQLDRYLATQENRRPS